jgi:hypothetical protein
MVKMPSMASHSGGRALSCDLLGKLFVPKKLSEMYEQATVRGLAFPRPLPPVTRHSDAAAADYRRSEFSRHFP